MRSISAWKSQRTAPKPEDGPLAWRFARLLAGNIREQRLDEIWNGTTMRNYRQLVAENLLPG